jgi:hypothetical protein
MSLLSYFDLNKRVSSKSGFFIHEFVEQVIGEPAVGPELPRPSAAPSPAPPQTVTSGPEGAAVQPARKPSRPAPATRSQPQETSPLLDRIVEEGRLTRSTHISLAEQLLMYFGTVVGVVFSSAVMSASSGKTTSLSVSISTVVVALVIAFVVIPIAFEKLTIKPDAPLVARFGLFVQHGVFWHVLFGAVGKAIAA